MPLAPAVALGVGAALLLLRARRRRRPSPGSYTFGLDDTRWLAHLDAEGFVVLRGALAADECALATSLMWEWLEGLGSGLRRGDPRTWSDGAWPGHQRFGFLTTHGAAHCAGAWFVRSRPLLRKAFGAIWNTDELLVSLDVPIAWRPWWLDAAWTPSVERLHVDQNPFFKRGRHCVQGMVPLLPVSAATGGLQIAPRTHTDEVHARLREFYPRLELDSDDWCELGPADPFIGEGVLVVAGAGDLILWDSRLVHGGRVGTGVCGMGAGVGSGPPAGAAPDAAPFPAPGLARLSLAVCMTARSRATEEVLARRREALRSGEAHTHWPHLGVAHTLGDTGGAAIRSAYTPSALNPEQLALVG